MNVWAIDGSFVSLGDAVGDGGKSAVLERPVGDLGLELEAARKAEYWDRWRHGERASFWNRPQPLLNLSVDPISDPHPSNWHASPGIENDVKDAGVGEQRTLVQGGDAADAGQMVDARDLANFCRHLGRRVPRANGFNVGGLRIVVQRLLAMGISAPGATIYGKKTAAPILRRGRRHGRWGSPDETCR